MTTETETTTAPYPWERTEPFVPTLTASLVVRPATPLGTFDFAPDGMSYRVAGLHIGDLTLHIGGSEGDGELIAVADQLINALQTLRTAALLRLADV